MYTLRFRPFGHLFSIVTLAYSPNGQLIATGTVDKKIRIWEALTVGQVGDALEGHAGYIQALAFSPDGRRLVSGALDDGLRVWDVDTHEIIAGPFEDDAHTWIRSVMYSPDGELIASGGNDGLLCLWNAYTHERVAMIQHSGPVTSLSFSPNGERIASSKLNVTGSLYRTSEGDLRHFAHGSSSRLFGHFSTIVTLAYSPDGSLITTGSADSVIRIWDSRTGHQSGDALIGHTSWIQVVAYSPDGGRLVSGAHNDRLRVWDTKT
ncbi:WD40 repeat-like protein, partial [Coniophora puteana RWD-64-598 SS2]